MLAAKLEALSLREVVTAQEAELCALHAEISARRSALLATTADGASDTLSTPGGWDDEREQPGIEGTRQELRALAPCLLASLHFPAAIWGYLQLRIPKAALNMATRNIRLELKRKRCLAIALHSGTTDTGISKPFQKGVKPEKLFLTEFSVDQMLKTINSAEEEHSGHLFAWDGQLIPF
ncbi:hypothetical protein T492DRAFT_844939 [Pavlovales sp. CCMP2436]|nr:hypothetical protein T492DRAFT_844939 [Pavlovales sp. CCMP2436]